MIRAIARRRKTIVVLKTIRHLLELIRFSHTLFALPFALLSAVMAWYETYTQVSFHNWLIDAGDNAHRATPQFAQRDGVPLERLSSFRLQDLLGILICMVAARSFAMSMNRLADRKLDAENPRTASRHLPAGIVDVRVVIAFAAACAVIFVASTLCFLPNWLPLALSAPVLAFLAGYSYAKRFTALAHFWLGAALALSPVAAWIAIRGQQVLAQPADLTPALILGGAVLTWVAGFDIIYACQDRDADVRAKLHSVPVAFGVGGALRLAAGCHFLTVLFLACLPFVYPPFGLIFAAGVTIVGVLLIYEHRLVRPDDLSRVNAAFFNVNVVVSVGLFVVGSLDLLTHRVGY